MTEWEIRGRELVNCNCAYGCPCQFNARPTRGHCEAAGAFLVEKGHHGDVSLDGMLAASMYQWPGPIHEGGGTMQLIIDETATPEQRASMERIMTGADTVDMGTMWWVFSTMSPTRLETLFRPISLEIDVDRRIGRVSVPGVFETTAGPIRNPVTGEPHRARIDLPHGFEYRLAEIGSASTATSGAITLTGTRDSYAQFARLHLSNDGVVAAAA